MCECVVGLLHLLLRIRRCVLVHAFAEEYLLSLLACAEGEGCEDACAEGEGCEDACAEGEGCEDACAEGEGCADACVEDCREECGIGILM